MPIHTVRGPQSAPGLHPSKQQPWRTDLLERPFYETAGTHDSPGTRFTIVDSAKRQIETSEAGTPARAGIRIRPGDALGEIVRAHESPVRGRDGSGRTFRETLEGRETLTNPLANGKAPTTGAIWARTPVGIEYVRPRPPVVPVHVPVAFHPVISPAALGERLLGAARRVLPRL